MVDIAKGGMTFLPTFHVDLPRAIVNASRKSGIDITLEAESKVIFIALPLVVGIGMVQ